MPLAWVLLALLPGCDFTIRSSGDWQHVNDADKTVICVAPAPTYTVEQVGVVYLSASGTPDKPRWLRWANNDETVHPAMVPASQTAAISQFDITGSNWIIDRLVVRDAIYNPRVLGNRNVLQRMVFESPRAWNRPSAIMMEFARGSDSAVIDSVFRNPLRMPGMDSYAIYIGEAERVIVRGNEFIDLVDGVSNGPDTGGGNQIVENEFYQTPAVYTDCAGHFKTSGTCSCSEGMAVVPKGPSDKPESYIERNLLWGFQKTDPVCAGSGTPGVGFDFGSQAGTPLMPMLTRHFTVRDNVILAKLPYAIYLGREVEDLSFSGNYIANADYGISNVYGQRITITGSVFYNNGVDYFTSPLAQGTTYYGNRTAGGGQFCVTIRHLTNPGRLCMAY